MRRDEAKAAEGQQGSVAVPGPETPLPPSFDGEPQSHRYRFLESNSGWLARCTPRRAPAMSYLPSAFASPPA